MKSRINRLREVLLKRELTLAVAESMTGGAFSDLITSVPGASRYFLGGVVSYSSRTKAMLGVSDLVLKKHGPYSEKVAIGLAKGALKKVRPDLAVGITGIAHPDEGHRAPGAWVAVASNGSVWTKHVVCKAGARRNEARKRVAMAAVELVLEALRY